MMAAKVEESGHRLFISCDKGDIETVKGLLNLQEKELFINKHIEDNETPLFRATKRGHYHIVQLLLQHKAVVDSLNGEGECTPLMVASEHGYTEIVELLLRYKASVDAWICIARDKPQPFRRHFKLIEYGPEMEMSVWIKKYSYASINNYSWAPLMIASRNGHSTTVNVLLEYGADVNTLDEYNKRSALMIASANGHVETVDVLVMNGAYVSIQEFNGWSALMLASVSDHVQVVKLLLERGADINKTTIREVVIKLKTHEYFIDKGYSLLMIVCQHGCVKIAKLLLDSEHKKLTNINQLDAYQRSALMIASASRNVEIVKYLLKHGADVNLQDFVGRSALMYAIVNLHDFVGRSALMYAIMTDKERLTIPSEEECIKIIELLLKHEADINTQDHEGRSALMLASEVGFMDTAKLLLEHKADIGMKGKDGQSAFVHAINHGHVEIAYLLFKYGADVNVQEVEGKLSRSLIVASRNGRSELVKLLLLFGADVKIQLGGVLYIGKAGQSALMAASENGRSETVKLLLEYGAEVNLRNDDGRSALMFASMTGQSETANLLLEHGAYIDIRGKDGLSAFLLACKNNHVEMAELLLRHGADINIQEEEESIRSVLMLECEYGYTKVVQILLQLGANVNILRNDGWSALMSASEHGHLETVEQLLEYGAIVNQQNGIGDSALMITRNGAVANLLLKHGANISLKNNYGESALGIVIKHVKYGLDLNLLPQYAANTITFINELLLASRDMHTESVKKLLTFGVSANAQGNDGWSALHHACWNGNNVIGHLLLDYGANVDIKKNMEYQL